MGEKASQRLKNKKGKKRKRKPKTGGKTPHE